MLVVAQAGFGQDAPSTQPASTGKAGALIIVGSPGTPLYARQYRDRVERFVAVLKSAGLSSDAITVLSADADWKSPLVNGPTSAESIAAAVPKVASTLGANDQFILILIGHGAVDDNGATFMIPGPDLRMSKLHDLLQPIACRSQIVLNFSASSGDALHALAKPGRINLAGSITGQINDNDYAEFFLESLEKQPAGRSILAMYNESALEFCEWIVRQKQTDGQVGWIVEGRESTAIFKKLYDYPETAANRRLIVSPASNAPDAKPASIVGSKADWWAGRRMVTEYPSIDDLAQATPACAIGEKGFQAVSATKPDQDGYLADHTVLGSSAPVILPLPTTR